MKALKYALLGIAAAVLIAGAFAAYLVATFDPRDYEPRITALVKDKTGRTLHIGGELKLSVWPDIGVRLGAVSLSERGSDERFADAQNVRFTVKLRPLLSRTLVAEDLLLRGAHVRITRFADGRLNIDDLFKSEGPAPDFDVRRVKIERSTVSYRDVARGEEYELSAIEAETGRLTPSVVTPLKVSLALRDRAGALDVKGALDGRLQIDLAQQRYGLAKATLALTGRAGGVSGLSAQLKGTFSAETTAGEFGATDLSARLSGSVRDEPIAAQASVARIASRARSLVVESATVSVSAASASGATRMTLAAPAIACSEHAITAGAATLELDATRGEYTLHGAFASAVKFETPAQLLLLPKLDARISVRGARFPPKGLTGAMTGEARIDLAAESLRTSLTGTVAGSRVKADLGATGIAKPAYRFVVHVDQLDLDRYSTGSASRASGGTGFDVSSLSRLPATGTLHIGTLRSGALEARNVKLVVKP